MVNPARVGNGMHKIWAKGHKLLGHSVKKGGGVHDTVRLLHVRVCPFHFLSGSAVRCPQRALGVQGSLIRRVDGRLDRGQGAGGLGLVIERVDGVGVVAAEVSAHDKRGDKAGVASGSVVRTVGMVEEGPGHVGHVALGGAEAFADHKRLDAGVAGALWFCARDEGEEDLELRVEERHILAAENLSNKAPAWSEEDGGNIQSREQKLRLNVFVDVVQACHVWGAI
mmetsp:Transcript_47062/g.94307  ORF Transcript_47062/g.94307 Transcript_47062/m.94307 type:complete len:225 (+) Transcript_47062:236-910(+)